VWHGRSTPAAGVAGSSLARPATLPKRAVARNDAELLPLTQQFVFRNATAHRVSVVGDFNDWNPTRTPMRRASGDALWSVTVPIIPGRHVYAFMVDDSLIVLDPRAPQTRDPDLGVQGSVIIVGRP
jgi:1,4-alpha-glucan branching enzyme